MIGEVSRDEGLVTEDADDHKHEIGDDCIAITAWSDQDVRPDGFASNDLKGDRPGQEIAQRPKSIKGLLSTGIDAFGPLDRRPGHDWAAQVPPPPTTRTRERPGARSMVVR